MNYEIIGHDATHGVIEIQVTADFPSAIEWVDGYREIMGFYRYPEIVIQNDAGETKATHGAGGWEWEFEPMTRPLSEFAQ